MLFLVITIQREGHELCFSGFFFFDVFTQKVCLTFIKSKTFICFKKRCGVANSRRQIMLGQVTFSSNGFWSNAKLIR